MWVSSPRCWSRKEPKDKTAEALSVLWESLSLCDCISQWLLGYLPYNSAGTTPQHPLPSPLASPSYPSWRGRRAYRAPPAFPALQAPPLSPIQHFQWGSREKMRIGGLFQPACSRQREKNWPKMVGLGASSVGMTRLSATVEESVPCALISKWILESGLLIKRWPPTGSKAFLRSYSR